MPPPCPGVSSSTSMLLMAKALLPNLTKAGVACTLLVALVGTALCCYGAFTAQAPASAPDKKKRMFCRLSAVCGGSCSPGSSSPSMEARLVQSCLRNCLERSTAQIQLQHPAPSLCIHCPGSSLPRVPLKAQPYFPAGTF